MRLNVLADQAGIILAAQYTVSPSRLPLSSLSISEVVPSEGQSLYEVEVPSELQQHILQNTLATEIFKYRVESQGEGTRLIKIP
ncbi:hypothetical protein [Shimazuella kribbensis]|uniref:hypothetical protein n=1 Tax=Shimazuella kribbensis TaxID=139808 RepID=UPI00048D6F1F|nr:hypothetical protein [Shimazuella kribbensis]